MDAVGDRLALLYRVSQSFNSSLDLDVILRTVMDEVIAATRAERGFLMLIGDDGRLLCRAARGMDQQTIASPEFHVSRSVVEMVAREGRPLLTSNAQSDVRLGGRASVLSLGLRSILCVPLLAQGQAIGVAYVDNRLQAGIFTQADLDLLAAIAASAAGALENARLHRIAVEQARTERELQVAHDLQASLLPRSLPQIAGWQSAALWQPARKVAGDFYDVLVNRRRLGFVIADVCDKGMPAALFMALARTLVRASLSSASSPANGLRRANRLICADAADGMFLTLFYGQIDTATGDLVYINAGHNPALLYRRRDDQISELRERDMALGIEAALRFTTHSKALEEGDFLLLYTDGVVDAANEQGERFGRERLLATVHDLRWADAPQIMASLDAHVRDFAGAAAPADDVTAFIIQRRSGQTAG